MLYNLMDKLPITESPPFGMSVFADGWPSALLGLPSSACGSGSIRARDFDQMWGGELADAEPAAAGPGYECRCQSAERFPQPSAFSGRTRRPDAHWHALPGSCPHGICGKASPGRKANGAFPTPASIKAGTMPLRSECRADGKIH